MQNQETIILSSDTAPIQLSEADKNSITFRVANCPIAKLQTQHPECKNIIALFAHLHRDCKQPEMATQHTLNWLGVAAHGYLARNWVLVFQASQGAGKGFLIQNIIKPLFREYASIRSIYDEKEAFKPDELDRLRIIDNFVQTESAHKHAIAAALHHRSTRYLLLTQEFKTAPIDRRFLVARCNQKLNDGLRQAVIDEIERGGLLAFAQMLQGFDSPKADFPDKYPQHY